MEKYHIEYDIKPASDMVAEYHTMQEAIRKKTEGHLQDAANNIVNGINSDLARCGKSTFGIPKGWKNIYFVDDCLLKALGKEIIDTYASQGYDIHFDDNSNAMTICRISVMFPSHDDKE